MGGGGSETGRWEAGTAACKEAGMPLQRRWQAASAAEAAHQTAQRLQVLLAHKHKHKAVGHQAAHGQLGQALHEMASVRGGAGRGRAGWIQRGF